jgi:hypothetical protein
MFSKKTPLKKSLRYVFAFSGSTQCPLYAQLKKLISSNVIRCCVLQTNYTKTDTQFRGFFTLAHPKSISTLYLSGAVIKPSDKPHYVLYNMIKKHPFGCTEILRGPRFDLENSRNIKYSSPSVAKTLQDLDEIEGEYSINKKQSQYFVNEELLKDFDY